MTAKQKLMQWQDNTLNPKPTFWYRIAMTIFSALAVAGITALLVFMVDVRDSIKDSKVQKKDVEALKNSSRKNTEQINLIMLNDENHNIPTGTIRNIFREQTEEDRQ